MRKRQFTALGGWLLLFLLLCAVAVSGMAPQVWGGVVLLLVLPVGTWGMNFLLKEKLEAELKMPSTAEKGKEVQAEVTIQNHARIPAVHLFCTVQAGKQADRGELHTGAGHVCTSRRKWQK